MSAVASHRKKYLTVAILAAIGAHASTVHAAGASTVGSEFRANSETSGATQFPAVAADADGNFAVTWESTGHPGGSSYDVLVRVFDATASAQTGDLQVNTVANGGITGGDQRAPDVAMDSNGDFVVVWSGPENGTNTQEVLGQRYNAAGTPQGSNFRVNSETSGSQQAASVAMDSSGNFVVAYESVFDFLVCSSPGPDALGIAAQRYNAAGVAQGSEITYVNTYCTGSQSVPDIAMDSDGDFVIAWQSAGEDGSGAGVFARRYNSIGAPQGGQFQVNTTTSGDQRNPSVGMDGSGNFLVAWMSEGQDGSNFGIVGRLYNAAGIAQTGEIAINTTTTNSQVFPSVAAEQNSNFLVAWNDIFEVVNGGPDSNGTNGQDGGLSGVFAQAVSSTGTLLGSEIQLNSYTTNYQRFPAVAGDLDGNFVAVWQSLNQISVGAAEEIYGKRVLVTDGAAIDYDFDGNQRADLMWRNTVGATWFYLMDGATINSQGAGNTVSLDWSVRGLGDFNGDNLSDIFWRRTNGVTYFYFMNGLSIGSEAAGPTVDPAWSVAGVGDFDNDGKKDILWRRSSSGATHIYLMNGASIKSQAASNVVDPAWSVAGIGDFDNDGDDDIMWRKTSGATWFYFMNGTSISSESAGPFVDPAWSVAGIGDFNGNGADDILWRKASTGATWIYLMNGASIASQGAGNTVPTDWSVKAIRDFDGDGDDDIFWRRNSTGVTWFYFMNGLSIQSQSAGPTVSTNWSVVSPEIN